MPEELIPLDAIEEQAWRSLARFFVVAPRLLDEDLQRGAHISLSAYTVLLHLSEAPERALRITELANRAYLSGSRTTRLVDELIADGLVAKERNAEDGRGFDVSKLSGAANLPDADGRAGRGVVLMRTIMDEVRYNSTGNRVTLVKRRDRV